ncbi:homeobox-leucine zipper protein GLABRA 2-like [Primulina tabacum]|uniref:homeobox-leucine zipper protein GLABRA 2-like n=1 Tax=Primulina tabacum TaxID=48773 RepID=UPI003F5AA93B
MSRETEARWSSIRAFLASRNQEPWMLQIWRWMSCEKWLLTENHFGFEAMNWGVRCLITTNTRNRFLSKTPAAKCRQKKSVEASRDSGVVFVDLPWLVKSFMDANQWKELFPNLISEAATVDIICHGETNKDGAVHLHFFAEIQILTPMVATREMYFIRYCKQLNAHQWAITDVSIDKVEDNTDTSVLKCRKCPSGCIIEYNFNGHCKVSWVELLESQKSTVNSLYRSIVNSGQAFSAKHWISTLQQQCERQVFYMATNVPTKDSSGVTTLAGRKSILKLAQRMTASYCRALSTSRYC